MERTYLPVLLLLGFVVANAALILLISHLTLRPRPTAGEADRRTSPACRRSATRASASP